MCLMTGGPLMCPSLKVPAFSKLGTKHLTDQPLGDT